MSEKPEPVLFSIQDKLEIILQLQRVANIQKIVSNLALVNSQFMTLKRRMTFKNLPFKI